MKPLAYCLFVLLLLNPVMVLCYLFIGLSYLPLDTGFVLVASCALSLAWTEGWVAIRNNNSRLDYVCRKRMNWL